MSLSSMSDPLPVPGLFDLPDLEPRPLNKIGKAIESYNKWLIIEGTWEEYIAKKTGINIRRIKSFVNNKKQPRLDELSLIAKALNYNMKHLIQEPYEWDEKYLDELRDDIDF